MDNAAFHRKKPLQEMVQKYGHILLFMPTYSPDLNPIEHKWVRGQKHSKDIPMLYR
jgi:transposase